MPPTSHDLSRQRHWVCALQLAERRRMLGLTQQDVVDRLADMGVAATNRSMSAMEHGQGLDVGRLPELAAALECTVTYLLGLTMDPHRWEPDEDPPQPRYNGRARTGLSRFVPDEETADHTPARAAAPVSHA
jgi:transcriptional regulator with XRE-family HTH domain